MKKILFTLIVPLIYFLAYSAIVITSYLSTPEERGNGLILAGFILSWPSSLFTASLLLKLNSFAGHLVEGFLGVVQFLVLGLLIDLINNYRHARKTNSEKQIKEIADLIKKS